MKPLMHGCWWWKATSPACVTERDTLKTTQEKDAAEIRRLETDRREVASRVNAGRRNCGRLWKLLPVSLIFCSVSSAANPSPS